MRIKLGETVIGTDGKLGEIHGFFMDPKSRRAEQIIVKPALSEARLVNIGHVERGEDEQVYLDVDKSAFDASERFDANAYRRPGGEPTILPPASRFVGGTLNVDMQGGMTGEPGEGIPGPIPPAASEITPLDEQEPVVSRDLEVVDVNGEKVGKVHAFAVESVTGIPELLTLHQGALFGHEVNVPVDWIQDITAEAIMLKVGKEELRKK